MDAKSNAGTVSWLQRLRGWFHGARINAFMLFVIALLGGALSAVSFKDTALKDEDTFVSETAKALADLKPSDPDFVQKMAVIKARLDVRPCHRHPGLERLFPDFAEKIKPVCVADAYNAYSLTRLEAVKKTKALQPTRRTAYAPYVLDVLWCESLDGANDEDRLNSQLASSIARTVTARSITSRVRVKKLARELITPDSGYDAYYGRGTTAGYTVEDGAVFTAIRSALGRQGIRIELRPWDGPSDHYLSIFVCNNARTVAPWSSGHTLPGT